MGAGRGQTSTPLVGGRFGTDWWRHGVIYQVYPRSFADSDGDGIGDLPGVLAHLDYLVDLGIDAIWLSPIYPSPGRDVGYDVSDHAAVDPRFGTDADFDRLVDAAHAQGIRIVLDLVMNHTSDEHRWFDRESRRRGPGRRPTGTCGATRRATTRPAHRCRPTTGCRGSVDRPGRGRNGADSSTCTRSSSSSPS